MQPREFAENVKQTYHFLEQLGFVISRPYGYCVRYDSEEVFVVLHYDATRSYEIGLELGLQAGISRPVERPFTISEMLRVVGRSELGKQAAFIQSKEEGVKGKLLWIADLLSEHGRDVLAGDREVFESLDKQRDEDCATYAMETELARVVPLAKQAWKSGRFDEVIKYLEPIAQHLPGSERKRLAMAYRRSGK